MSRKTIIPMILMVFVFAGAQAQDDAIIRFFSKYMEDDRFSRVYISPKMMQMAGGFLKSNEKDLKADEKDLGELIQKVRGIRILSGSDVNGKPMYEEVMNTLTRNQYEDLMDVQNKDQSLKFMVREENGLVKELLMLSGSEKDFTLLSMMGNFTYQDLNILAEKTNIPGMEEYKNGNKKK